MVAKYLASKDGTHVLKQVCHVVNSAFVQGSRIPRTRTNVRFHVYIFQIHVQKIGTVREMHVRFFYFHVHFFSLAITFFNA